MLWKSHIEGMPPVHPAMQGRHLAFSKSPPREAAQTRQHHPQQMTSSSTLEKIQNKQNLDIFIAITGSEVLNQPKKPKVTFMFIFSSEW